MKEFNEFLKKGIVKKQSPDNSRANALIKEAQNDYEFLKEILNKIPLSDKNSNRIIIDSYDIIMKVIRSKMLKQGLNASGYGAHEAEVAYLKKLGFSEKEIEFANQLRYFRNGIEYYGKSFDKGYAKEVLDFMERVRRAG